MKFLFLTKWDGTSFVIPTDTVVSCDDQRSSCLDPKPEHSYWLKQSNGNNWHIKESPEEVLKLMTTQ